MVAPQGWRCFLRVGAAVNTAGKNINKNRAEHLILSGSSAINCGNHLRKDIRPISVE
jgi:hypothetical protein